MTQMRHMSQKSQKTYKSGPMTRSSPPYRGYHSNLTRIPYRGYHSNLTRIPYRIISDPYWISITTPHPLCPDLDPIGSSDRSMTHLMEHIHKPDSSPYCTTLDPAT